MSEIIPEKESKTNKFTLQRHSFSEAQIVKSHFKSNFELKKEMLQKINTRNQKGEIKSYQSSRSIKQGVETHDKSLISETKYNIIEIMKEMSSLKLENSKYKNEINILNEKIKSIKSTISLKNQEIEILAKMNRDIYENTKNRDKSQHSGLSEIYAFREKLIKNNYALKSTISVLIDCIDTFLIAPLIELQKLSLNNNILYDYEMFSNIKKETNLRNILKEIKHTLSHNLNYLNVSFGINLDEEINKIDKWNFIFLEKPIISTNYTDKLNDLNRLNDFPNSPKFNHSMEILKNEIGEDFKNVTKNINVLIEDNPVCYLTQENVIFNDNLTYFNYEILGIPNPRDLENSFQFLQKNDQESNKILTTIIEKEKESDTIDII